MLVVDSSVAMKWILKDESSRKADEVLRRVNAEGAVVPAIFPFEVENILLLAERRRRIEQMAVDAGIKFIKGLPIELEAYPITAIGRLIGAARAYALSIYDTSYLHVAQARGARLVTADGDLHRAARDLALSVEFVSSATA